MVHLIRSISQNFSSDSFDVVFESVTYIIMLKLPFELLGSWIKATIP